MDKDDADCGPLLEGTTNALGEEAMQMLLISTQRMNLALCIKYAVKGYVHWYIDSLIDLTCVIIGHLCHASERCAWLEGCQHFLMILVLRSSRRLQIGFHMSR
jgi:hypothetical protein